MTVAEMSTEELRKLIRETVWEALHELIGDPDAGLELRPAFERRLRQSLNYLEAGGKTISLEEMKRSLEAD